jgi:membrane-bound lytic murein transglycosylase A
MICYRFLSWVCIAFSALFLSACGQVDPTPDTTAKALPPPLPVLTPVSYTDLPGWRGDSMQDAPVAFARSCEKLVKIPANTPFKPQGTYGDWHRVCNAFIAMQDVDAPTFKAFIEHWFTPYQVKDKKEGAQGLFTGYYEPLLHGSHTRHGTYQTPLYAKPENMFVADLGLWDESLKGKKITGLIEGTELTRVPERAKIETAGMSRTEVLVWVNDPVDAFFLHIQGSGIVKMEDGSTQRVGYAAQNGHPYYAIGRALIERGELTKENVSLQSIRQWMATHPEGAQELMNLNPSYIFFRLLDSEGPEGAQGVALTQLRSLAVDKNLYSYGMPIWVDAEFPVPRAGQPRLQRLLMAQDTGGAITGTVRGDVFWGHGEDAALYAGQMKSKGSMWVLLPKL